MQEAIYVYVASAIPNTSMYRPRETSLFRNDTETTHVQTPVPWVHSPSISMSLLSSACSRNGRRFQGGSMIWRIYTKDQYAVRGMNRMKTLPIGT